MKNIVAFVVFFYCLNLHAQTVGTLSNQAASINGYTLFSPNPDTNTYLIDNCGHLMNRWSSRYFPALSAYLLEDGSLLRTCRLNNQTFTQGGSGGRIERYDWDGNLIWEFNFSNAQYCQHHDIEYLANGHILILATELKTQAECIAAGRDPNLLQDGEIWSEFVVEIAPVGTDSGTIVWEWHSWDHLVQDYDMTKNNYQAQTNIPNKFNLNYVGNNSKADWMHANSIDYNAGLDQIVLCSKKWSELWVIDHSTTTAEAQADTGGNAGMGGDILYRWGNPVCYGQFGQKLLFDPHDIHWIDSGLVDAGKLMIFNNGKNRGWSSVDIIQPPIDNNGQYNLTGSQYGPSTTDWSYSDPTPSNFFAVRISGAQRIENGNTLVCSGPNGYFFEVDSNNNKVWEYINPVTINGISTQGQGLAGGNSVFRAYRYSPNYAGFAGRTLTQVLPIELNPTTSNCSLYTSLPAFQTKESNFSVYPNPFDHQIQIEQQTSENTLDVVIYNIMGQIVYKTKLSDSISTLQLAMLPKGSYILHLGNYPATIILKN